ncbi:MAG: alpha/beta hydrolase [Turicibacter sp.]
MEILLIVFIGLSGLLCMGFFINRACLKKENKELVAKGQMIEVDGGYVNVYSKGEGDVTVVILSGFGVSLPIAEYGPLLRELKDKYQVVICDYKGLGFSSMTSVERSNQHMLDETREVLKKAGFEPPYVLMPHSIGGIYSEYYAAKYPEEVAGIVLLDGTPSISPEKPMPAIVGSIFKFNAFLQNCGVTRVQLLLPVLPYRTKNGYTEEEMSLLKIFTKRYINDTMINQMKWFDENIKEVECFNVPDEVPVLKVISKKSSEMGSKQAKLEPMAYQEQHLSKLGKFATYSILDCGHNMHQTHAKEVAKLADQFISKKIKTEEEQ